MRRRQGKPIRRDFSAWLMAGMFGGVAGPIWAAFFVNAMRFEGSYPYHLTFVALSTIWTAAGWTNGIRAVDDGIQVRDWFRTRHYRIGDVKHVDIGEVRGSSPGVILRMSDGTDTYLHLTLFATANGHERVRRKIEQALHITPRPLPHPRQQY